MRQPILIEIETNDPNAAQTVQQGLQNLVNNIPANRLTRLAEKINKKPQKVAGTILKYMNFL